MAEYKLVASDLDGTLLKTDQTLSPENKAAIAEMGRRGVQFAISTGRTYGEIIPQLRNDPNIRYAICSDGAMIYDKHTQTRYTDCFSGELKKLVLDALFSCQTWMTVRICGVSFMDAEATGPEGFRHHRVSQYYQDAVAQVDVPIWDFKNFCYGVAEIEQITVFFHSDEELAACEQAFRNTGLLDTSCSSPHSFEVYKKTAGKGNALLRLARELGIDQSQTIAIGDTTNDSSIVQAAGLGLATSNAMEELKSIADAVICSNEEHVAQFVLEHYL